MSSVIMACATLQLADLVQFLYFHCSTVPNEHRMFSIEDFFLLVINYWLNQITQNVTLPISPDKGGGCELVIGLVSHQLFLAILMDMKPYRNVIVVLNQLSKQIKDLHLIYA